MKYEDIENIWSTKLDGLSRADRGRIYFERAKQVVARALADPVSHPQSVRGGRFNRTYLIGEIHAGPAVAVQNPKIRDLLEQADKQLGRLAFHSQALARRPMPGGGSGQTEDLQAIIDELRRTNEIQAAENTDLKRKLRESGWMQTDLAEHGRLPW